MRSAGAAFLLCLTVGLVQPALGQETCAPNPKKLGVTRTIVVDTSQGPRFGAQYKDASLLADGEIVLTFDDGPSRAYTRPILEALSAHCTKATFFMVGRMAISDPEMVKEVARHGHTVAAHTWSHGNLQALNSVKAQAEIELGFSAVQQALGKPIAPFFRFPYLRDTPSSLNHLQGRQIATFSVDVDSKDFLTKDPATVHERVMSGLAARRKGIILFHDIHASTAGALPRLLNDLKERSFRVVHVMPKADAETMADYDTLARQEAERKSLAKAGQPLAKRSLTWPSTVFSDAKAGEPKATKAPPAVPHPSPPGAPEGDWTVNVWR